MSVSNYDYPEDEFDVGEDDGPVPVGVHRAQVPRWRSWVPLLAIIIIVPALAWGAVTLAWTYGLPELDPGQRQRIRQHRLQHWGHRGPWDGDQWPGQGC